MPDEVTHDALAVRGQQGVGATRATAQPAIGRGQEQLGVVVAVEVQLMGRRHAAAIVELAEEELADTVRNRKICYDTEPYYTTHKGRLVQIGYQINLYGTFPQTDKKPSPDDHEFGRVLGDMRKIAKALSKSL